MKNRSLIVFLLVAIYLLNILISLANSELLLVKDNLMYLGYGKKNGKFETCYYNLVEIGSGQLLEVTMKCETAKGRWPIAFNSDMLLMESFTLMENGKFSQSQKMLELVLKKEPDNPLALNNLAAVMVEMKKFDKADTYLNQALLKSGGYTVQVNRVCQVGGICLAFKPVTAGKGNQELAPLIMLNLDFVKQYMSSELPGKGPR